MPAVSLFKPTVVRKGKRCKTAVWWACWRDATRKRRTVSTKTRDKSVAKQFAAKLEHDLGMGRLGLHDPYAQHRETPLLEHLGQFERAMDADDCTADHVAATIHNIAAMLESCKFKRWDQVNDTPVKEFLTGIRDKRCVSTANHYLTSIKSFFAWMASPAQNRAPANPLASLQKFPAAGFEKCRRRALTQAEFAKLIQTTQASQVMRLNMDGRHRAILYLVAASGCAYRRNELASLTPESFDLESDPPTVAVAVQVDKSGFHPPVPLRSELAAILREWLPTREGQELFPIKGAHTAECLRADLKAAGIEYVVGGRRFDFHSLRGQFATTALAAGVAPTTVQQWMRHSTLAMTLAHYNKPTSADDAAQLAKLPPLPPLLRVVG